MTSQFMPSIHEALDWVKTPKQLLIKVFSQNIPLWWIS